MSLFFSLIYGQYMSSLEISQSNGTVILGVKVIPSSSKTAIAGILDGVLKVKISSAPEKGKANQALIAFLANKLGIKKNAISITAGVTNSHKKISVTGISADIVIKMLLST